MTVQIDLDFVECFNDLPDWFRWDFQRHRFGGMSFASATSGWLLLEHLPLHTNDGGRSWRHVELRSPGGLLPKRVAATENSCWLVLSQTGDPRPTRIPIVRVSSSGGIHEPIWVGATNGWYSKVSQLFFAGPEHGWLIATECVNGQERGVIWATVDSGRSWKLVAKQALIPEHIAFTDSKNGWQLARGAAQDRGRAYRMASFDDPKQEYLIGGHRYAVLSTTDGGRAWRERQQVSRDLFALSVAIDIVHAAGGGGVILRSPGDGVTWSRPRSYTRSDIYALSFHPCGRGIAVGDEGLILFTEDNGAHWRRMKHPFRRCSFHAAHFATEQSGVIVNPTGVYTFELRK